MVCKCLFPEGGNHGQGLRPVGRRGILYANCRVNSPDGKSIKLDDWLKTNDEMLAGRYLNDLKKNYLTG